MEKPRPEILAPAGDRDALAAALAAGADAVYLGLDDGFNARARAENFPSDRLAEVAAWVHRAGARLYVTVNTLVFESELAIVEELIRRVAAAGADAVIVQDPAVVILARAHGLEVHASTQMTASSPLAIELLKELGISRVVVPRELSIDEIRAYKAGTDVELEVFVHGALCVAWSGQCLSSEAWGGRSANRGQCAQACRLPYELIVDGAPRDLGDVAYLLSPRDLVGIDRVAELAELGVTSLKIEGRLKGPAYVATAVAQYRRAVDPAFETTLPLDRAALEVAYSRGASQGFLGGADHQTLVEGRFPRHRGLPLGRVTCIDGDDVEVVPDAAQRALDATRVEPLAGMGVVFDAGTPEATEQGGPIFSVHSIASGYQLRFGRPGPDLTRVHVGDFVWITSDPRVTSAGARAAVLGKGPLGRIAIALDVRGAAGEPLIVTARAGSRVAVAQSASRLATARGAGITHALLADKLGALGGTPFHLGELTEQLPAGLHIPVSELKELRRTLVAQLDGRDLFPAGSTAEGRCGSIDGRDLFPAGSTAEGRCGSIDGRDLFPAGSTAEGRCGSIDGRDLFPAGSTAEGRCGSIDGRDLFPAGSTAEGRCGSIDGRDLFPAGSTAEGRCGSIDGRDLFPAGSTAEGRCGSIDAQIDGTRVVATAAPGAVPITSHDAEPLVVPLCRDDAQLDAVLDAGAREVELDWMELVGLGRAVERARSRGARAIVATVRVQKPGEERIDAHLARLQPDGVLVRSWGSLAALRDRGIDRTAPPFGGAAGRALELHGDFSLNVTNSMTAGWVLGKGLSTVAAAHDLDRDQLAAMLAVVPRGRVAVAIHHHIATFHTEHCVYAHLLSKGRDFRTCGRPCEQHRIALRDRVGLVHPVSVDVGCRNTVFNAQAQSAAAMVPELLVAGVRRFRVELVRESAAETRRLYDAYTKLVAGAIEPSEVVRIAAAHEQFGVTRGTMRTLTVLAR